MTTASTQAGPAHAGWLPLLAPASAALFTAAWLVLGALSPGYPLFDLVIEPYSPISQPISGLGLGRNGAYMNAAFVLGGLLMAVGVIGIGRAWPVSDRPRSRRAALVLLGLTGVGMVIDGFFTLESVLPHLTGFVLALGMPSVGFMVAGFSLRTSRPRLSTGLHLAGWLSLGLLLLFFVTFDPYSAGENVGVAGAVQRLLVTVVLGALALLGWTAWRAGRRRPGVGRAQPSIALGSSAAPRSVVTARDE